MRPTIAAVALLSALAACGQQRGQNQDSSNVEQVRADVQNAVRAYVDAINRADVSAFVELYSRDPRVTSVEDGNITRGWDRIRSENDSILTGLQGRVQANLGSVDVVPLGSQHALALAPYVLNVQTQNGVAQVRGAISLVLQRGDSAWKIIHEHSSTGRNAR